MMMKSSPLLAFVLLVGVAHASFFNLLGGAADTCPKAPYIPVNKPFTYGPASEPVQLCFDSTNIPDGYNGFLLNFSKVDVNSTVDSLCAIVGAVPFTRSGTLDYIVSGCSMQANSVLIYGGVCESRTNSSAYWVAFGTQTSLLNPAPSHTVYSLTASIQWTKTLIC